MKDYFNYKGKSCVVTGSASGMGLAVTKILVDMGAKVYALDVNETKVEGIEQALKVDLSSKESIDEVFAKLPQQIDSFFGIAGLSGSKTDYMTTFNVNYTANVYICEKYLKDRMPENSSILFVSSTAGISWQENMQEQEAVLKEKEWDAIEKVVNEIIVENTPGIMAYMYSKRLMNAYSAMLALELGANKIRVNAVLPGATDTGMKDEFAQSAGGMDNLVSHAGIAKRLATSDELAKPIVFLNSDMATFISGIELIVDYANDAMVRLKEKEYTMTGPVVLDLETLQKMMAAAQ